MKKAVDKKIQEASLFELLNMVLSSISQDLVTLTEILDGAQRESDLL